MDTLLFATVFGATEEEIKTNSQRALTLFKNNWKPIKAPPAPIVESFTNDKKVTLIWGTDSENDPKFEGYKVYRSQDNGQSWGAETVSYTHLRAHETVLDLVCRLLLEKKTHPSLCYFMSHHYLNILV